MFCCVYFAWELLLRLLYTHVPITPATDTANRANHSAGLLLSPVCTLVVTPVFVLFVVGLVDSVGLVVDLV